MDNTSTEAVLLRALANTEAGIRRGELNTQHAIYFLAGYIELHLPAVSRALVNVARAASENDTPRQVLG